MLEKCINIKKMYQHYHYVRKMYQHKAIMLEQEGNAQMSHKKL